MSEEKNYVDTDAEQAIRANVTVLQGGRAPVRFRRERFADIEPKSIAWLIKYFMPAIGVGIVYGASTVGKSFWVLYVCLRVAMGKTVLEHRTRRAGVLYFAAEGQDGMRKRIKGVREKFGLKTEAFHFIGAPLNLLDDAHVDGLITEALEADAEMREACGVGLGLIVIDTTSASMPGGNENTSEDMGRLLAAGSRVSQATSAMVLFVSHPGKNEQLGVRGWSGQVGNVDCLYYLNKSDEDPAIRVGTVQKLKDGEDGERFAYRLKQFDIGVDEDGDAITSAYPVFEEPPLAGGVKRKKAVDEKPGPALVMRAMHLMIEAGQCEIVPGYPGVPPNTKGVRRVPLRVKASSIGYAGEDEKPDTVKRSVNRDITALVAAEKLRVEGDLIWPVKR